jgi:hypothetical protein
MHRRRTLGFFRAFQRREAASWQPPLPFQMQTPHDILASTSNAYVLRIGMTPHHRHRLGSDFPG